MQTHLKVAYTEGMEKTGQRRGQTLCPLSARREQEEEMQYLTLPALPCLAAICFSPFPGFHFAGVYKSSAWQSQPVLGLTGQGLLLLTKPGRA